MALPLSASLSTASSSLSPVVSPLPLRLRPLSSCAGHTDRVWCVRWSPSGQLLASASGDRHIRLWALEGAAAETADSAEADSSSPSSSSAAVRLRCVSVLSGVHTRTVRCIAWSPCGRLLASAGFDGRVGVWRKAALMGTRGEAADETETAEWECVCVLEGHENEVKAVSWSLDGELLASCSRDKSIWLWEKVGATQPHVDRAGAGGGGKGGGAGEDEDGGGVAVFGAESLSFECSAVCGGHSADVKFVSLSSCQGRPLLLSCGYDNSIRLWQREDDGDDWDCTQELTGHTSTVWMAIFTNTNTNHTASRADGQRDAGAGAEDVDAILSTGDDRTIRLWTRRREAMGEEGEEEKVEEEKEDEKGATSPPQWRCQSTLTSPHTRTVFALDRATDGVIASAGGDDAIFLYCLSPSLELQVVGQARKAHAGDVNSSAPPPLHRLRSLQSPLTRSLLTSPVHCAGPLSSVAWHPQRTDLLASGGDDGQIKLWHRENARPEGLNINHVLSI